MLSWREKRWHNHKSGSSELLLRCMRDYLLFNNIRQVMSARRSCALCAMASCQRMVLHLFSELCLFGTHRLCERIAAINPNENQIYEVRPEGLPEPADLRANIHRSVRNSSGRSEAKRLFQNRSSFDQSLIKRGFCLIMIDICWCQPAANQAFPEEI